MVLVESIGKDFFDPKKGKICAVEDMSFEAKPGQTFGLLGVNGAGKTTILRMLSTLLKPSRGKAMINGLDVSADSQKVRESIGFLSTSTALYSRLTGLECLEYFGSLYGLDGNKLRSRINYVTETLDLGDYYGQLCDKMSTGQKQRISIARAILHDPPVVFFDEPTAGLDVVTSQTVLEFIELSKAQGKTVVFSTHIMSEAERICDNIAIVHKGKRLAMGSLQEMLGATGSSTLESAFLSLVGYRSEVANQ